MEMDMKKKTLQIWNLIHLGRDLELAQISNIPLSILYVVELFI